MHNKTIYLIGTNVYYKYNIYILYKNLWLDGKSEINIWGIRNIKIGMGYFFEAKNLKKIVVQKYKNSQ